MAPSTNDPSRSESALARHHAGNDSTAVPSIDAEVRVGGENDRIGERLCHPNKAGIGETHRQVGIFLHEPQYVLHLLAQMESRHDCAAAEQRSEPVGAARA